MDLVAFYASPTWHMLPPTPPKILLTSPLCWCHWCVCPPHDVSRLWSAALRSATFLVRFTWVRILSHWKSFFEFCNLGEKSVIAFLKRKTSARPVDKLISYFIHTRVCHHLLKITDIWLKTDNNQARLPASALRCSPYKECENLVL